MEGSTSAESSCKFILYEIHSQRILLGFLQRFRTEAKPATREGLGIGYSRYPAVADKFPIQRLVNRPINFRCTKPF